MAVLQARQGPGILVPPRAEDCHALPPEPTFSLPEPPWNLLSNFTHEAFTTGHRQWLVPVGQALTTVVNTAIVLRLLNSDHAQREKEFLAYWRYAWCTFLSDVVYAATAMPEPAHVVSALGTSASSILVSTLPQALQPLLNGVVLGKRNLADGHMAAQNISLISLQHLECAMVLGKEAIRFGFSRVARAVFHGDITYRGNSEYTVHRSDSILSALTGGLGSASATASGSVPRVVEIGVHYGDFAYRLLRRHPTLRWIGVDPFECEVEKTELGSFRKGFTGSQVLQIARHQLRPWLGLRAQIIVARSTDVAEAEIGRHPPDAVFVDAVHTEDAVKEDLAHWAPRVRAGGLVAGHDYAFGYEGVVEAVHAKLPKGCTLHLAPNAVFWWLAAPPGSNVSC